MELARKKLYQGRRFSEAGEAELHRVPRHGLEEPRARHRGLRRQRPDAWPRRCWTSARRCASASASCATSHLARLRRGLAESLETSEIHLDVLTNLKRISSHITALVFPILEEES